MFDVSQMPPIEHRVAVPEVLGSGGSSASRRSYSRIFAAAASAALHGIAAIALVTTLARAVPERLIERKSSGLPLIATAFFIDERPPELVFTVAPISTPESESTISAERIPLPPIQPVAMDSFDEATETVDVADAEELARLQGLYVRQLNARFARILEEEWPTRRVVVSCQAKVGQDERGNVLVVNFDACDLKADEQKIMERAIRRSSPLPRPPAGLAMGSYLTLDLTAL